jgi:hypothetical protein
MVLRGKLEQRDTEGGAWVLVTASGRFVLLGNVPAAMKDQQVRVEGDKEEGPKLIGPHLRVTKLSPS